MAYGGGTFTAQNKVLPGAYLNFVSAARASAQLGARGTAALFLPLAVCLGFRREELVAILVMLSSATTVSCYVMARNMGHEGVLTSSVVMLTTLFSAFTMTGWLYILKCMELD